MDSLCTSPMHSGGFYSGARGRKGDSRGEFALPFQRHSRGVPCDIYAPDFLGAQVRACRLVG